MNAGLYSMYDNVARTFSAPEAVVNDELAVRNFKIRMGSFPKEVVKDTDLYKIGEFDTDTGKVKGLLPSVLTKGSSIMVGDDNGI